MATRRVDGNRSMDEDTRRRYLANSGIPPHINPAKMPGSPRTPFEYKEALERAVRMGGPSFLKLLQNDTKRIAYSRELRAGAGGAEDYASVLKQVAEGLKQGRYSRAPRGAPLKEQLPPVRRSGTSPTPVDYSGRPTSSTHSDPLLSTPSRDIKNSPRISTQAQRETARKNLALAREHARKNPAKTARALINSLYREISREIGRPFQGPSVEGVNNLERTAKDLKNALERELKKKDPRILALFKDTGKINRLVERVEKRARFLLPELRQAGGNAVGLALEIRPVLAASLGVVRGFNSALTTPREKARELQGSSPGIAETTPGRRAVSERVVILDYKGLNLRVPLAVWNNPRSLKDWLEAKVRSSSSGVAAAALHLPDRLTVSLPNLVPIYEPRNASFHKNRSFDLVGWKEDQGKELGRKNLYAAAALVERTQEPKRYSKDTHVADEYRIITFGKKHAGKRLWEVLDKSPGYIAYLTEWQGWRSTTSRDFREAFDRFVKSPYARADLEPYLSDTVGDRASPPDLYRDMWLKKAKYRDRATRRGERRPGLGLFDRGGTQYGEHRKGHDGLWRWHRFTTPRTVKGAWSRGRYNEYDTSREDIPHFRSKDRRREEGFAVSDNYESEEQILSRPKTLISEALGGPGSFGIVGSVLDPLSLERVGDLHGLPSLSGNMKADRLPSPKFRRQEQRFVKEYDPDYYESLRDYEFRQVINQHTETALDLAGAPKTGVARTIARASYMAHVKHYETLQKVGEQIRWSQAYSRKEEDPFKYEGADMYRMSRTPGVEGKKWSEQEAHNLEALGLRDEAPDEGMPSKESFALRISKARSREELSELAQEFEDTFGTIAPRGQAFSPTRPDFSPSRPMQAGEGFAPVDAPVVTGMAWQAMRFIDEGALENIWFERWNHPEVLRRSTKEL